MTAVKSVVIAAEEAVQDLVAHPLSGQTTDVLDSVREVGESLGRLKLYLKRELLEVIDGSDGLDPSETDVLQRAGLRAAAIRPVQELSADESENQLRELVGAELLRSRSLVAVARELRAWSSKATPRSSAETVTDLDVVCPDELIQELGAFEPMRLHLDGLGAMAALAVAAAAAMCLPPPWMAIPAALLTIVLVALLARAGALKRRPSIRAKGKTAAIACAVLAGGAGYLAGMQFGGPTLTKVAAAVAAIGCLAWAWAIWRESIQRWMGSAPLRKSTSAVDAVVTMIANVAMNDWVLANPRLRHARTAARLADSLEEIGAELLGPLAPAGDGPPNTKATHWSDTCNPAIRVDLSAATDSALLRYASAVREIIARDHADLIKQAVEDGWAELVTGPDEDGREIVVQAFSARLGHYRRDLREHGLFRSSSRRAGEGADDEGSPRLELLARIWNETEGLNELLSVPVESELVQLCAPQHLLLLDEDPAGAHMVRFAPDCVRVKGSATLEKSSMFLAGVIRLVPLRAGTVRFREPLVRRAAGLSEVVGRRSGSSGSRAR